LENFDGPFKVFRRSDDFWGTKDFWAPEVHKYNGAYYMFTTYLSKTTGHRGCTIMKADNPLGPFVEISDGHATPKDWDSIDGTLYVDDEGQPWMVFVHEWTSMEDSIGSFAVAKLSDDLTHFISEPVELFKAKDAPWAISGVTDGCWMYKCEDGSLIMLWSNFSANGYVVATAKSESGDITGPWIQSEKPFYEKSLIRNHDGGHGMIFTAEDGKMYLCLHSPNTETETKITDAIFVRVDERNGELKISYWN
jgi:GH43 family beta-xylosidase